MKILVLGRTLPKSGMGSKGLCEFEQTNSLLQLGKVGYLFMETSSLLSVRFIKRTNRMNGRIPIVGVYLPVKGIYKHIYEYIRYKLFIMLYNEFVQNYWKPDIIHIHYPLLTINPKIIKFIKEKNIKLVITEHWSKVMKKELKKNQINELKYLLENADAFYSLAYYSRSQATYHLADFSYGGHVLQYVKTFPFQALQIDKSSMLHR